MHAPSSTGMTTTLLGTAAPSMLPLPSGGLNPFATQVGLVSHHFGIWKLRLLYLRRQHGAVADLAVASHHYVISHLGWCDPDSLLCCYIWRVMA